MQKSENVSIEKFFHLREKHNSDESTRHKPMALDGPVADLSREFIRSEERTLIASLAKIGIDISAFKRNRRYYVTDAVADFLNYFLDYFFRAYASQITVGAFENIPKDSLIELRIRLIKALYSLEDSQDDIERVVKKFESETGCPASFFAQQTSSFTVDMIDYLKATQPDMVPADKSKTSTPTFDLAQYANELARRANNFAQYANDLVQYASGVKLTQANSDSITQDKKPILDHLSLDDCDENTLHNYDKDPSTQSQETPTNNQRVRDHLTDQDWEELASQIEYKYNYDWRPQLVDKCVALLKDYCKQQNITFKDDVPINLHFPWDKTERADGQMGGSK